MNGSIEYPYRNTVCISRSVKVENNKKRKRMKRKGGKEVENGWLFKMPDSVKQIEGFFDPRAIFSRPSSRDCSLSVFPRVIQLIRNCLHIKIPTLSSFLPCRGGKGSARKIAKEFCVQSSPLSSWGERVSKGSVVCPFCYLFLFFFFWYFFVSVPFSFLFFVHLTVRRVARGEMATCLYREQLLLPFLSRGEGVPSFVPRRFATLCDALHRE